MNFLNINPIFLFILFAMGYVFGLLIRNPSAGKFLIFGFFGTFIYEPVKDAGLLASAAFIFGIILHHISLLSIFDSFQLYRATRAIRDHVKQDRNQGYGHTSQDEDLGPKGGAGGRSETADETHRKYEEHVNEQRRRKAQEEQPKQQKSQSQQSKAKPSQNGSKDAEKEKMRQEQERMKREQDRLNQEKERFRQEQASVKPAKDKRTDEEVLGLKEEYTLSDLKKAWRSEVARWHPDQLGNKPPHLRKQAEEELKRINTAFDVLKRKFD